jgi:hypothetical protein
MAKKLTVLLALGFLLILSGLNQAKADSTSYMLDGVDSYEYTPQTLLTEYEYQELPVYYQKIYDRWLLLHHQ